jgi:hypothetical protein
MIDQAIFTSARTSRGDGYQLVARSAGVSEAEARELTTWGPSHDSLFDQGPSAVSYNAWRLTDGRMCASRTLSAGAEFSQRGGARVYTQFLLADESIFERFACNPLAILKAALADGHLRVLESVPNELPQIELTGRASVVDRTAVDRLRSRLGLPALVAVIETILGKEPVALVGGLNAYLVYAAAINCLPPECRGEFSFTTGLKYSVRRPLRLFVGPKDANERRQIIRTSGCTILDCDDPDLPLRPIKHPWSMLLKKVLSGDRPLDLTFLFARHRAGLTTDNLGDLGVRLLAEHAEGKLSHTGSLRASGYLRTTDNSPDVFNARVTLMPGDAAAMRNTLRDTRREAHSLRETTTANEPREKRVPRTPEMPAPVSPAAKPASKNDSPRTNTPAPAASALRELARTSGVNASAATLAAKPATAVASLDAKTLERLEVLDDLVFSAIDGDAQAMARLRAAWPAAQESLSAEALEESREQYVRRATAVFGEHRDADARSPHSAAAALEVLTLILGVAPVAAAG